MRLFDGYLKKKLGDSYVLLAGGGTKSLSNLLGSIQYDSTNKKIQYKSGSATLWSDLVSFGSNAFNSTSYLPLTGGTLSGEVIVKSSSLQRGVTPGSRASLGRWWRDKNDNPLGGVEFVSGTDGINFTGLWILTNTNSSVGNEYGGIYTYKTQGVTGNKYAIFNANTGDFSFEKISANGGVLSLTSVNSFTIKKTSNQNSMICFNGLSNGSNTLFGYLGISGVDNPVFRSSSETEYTLLHANNYSSYALPKSGGTLTGNLSIKGELYLWTKTNSSLTDVNLDLVIAGFGYKNSTDTIKAWHMYSYQDSSENPAGIGYMPIVIGNAYPSNGGLCFTGDKNYSGTTYSYHWGIKTDDPLYLLHVNGSFGANSIAVNGGDVAINYNTDESRLYGICTYNTGGTQTGLIGYHNTGKVWIISPAGASLVWSDAVGKYCLRIGENELKYNTYNIIHAGNISSLTVYAAKYLMNRGSTTSGSNIVIADSGWSIGKTLNGCTNLDVVWSQSWKKNGQTYTTSGGSTSNNTDSGNIVMWLSKHDASNDLRLNIQIDGLLYVPNGIYGNLEGNVTGNVTGNSNTATMLQNRGTTSGTLAVTINSGIWAPLKTQSGYTNLEAVWGQGWTKAGLTYTPSGGSPTAFNDTGNITLWLAKSNTSNSLTINMLLDGLIFAGGGFFGNLTGNASTASNMAYTGLTGSGTTANQAIVSSGTANGWTLKTVSLSGHTHSYLPLTGGTITNGEAWTTITFSRTGTNGGTGKVGGVDANGLYFLHKSADDTKSITMYLKADDGLRVGGTLVSLDGHTHSYLPITNPTVSGYLQFNAYTGYGTGICLIYYNQTNDLLRTNNVGNLNLAGNLVLHAGNYSSYALPINGGTLKGGLTIKQNANATNYKLNLYADNEGGNISIYAPDNYKMTKSASTTRFYQMDAYNGDFRIYTETDGSTILTFNTSGSLSTTAQGTLWGASNDGSGSGLDADLLDGYHAIAASSAIIKQGIVTPGADSTNDHWYRIATLNKDVSSFNRRALLYVSVNYPTSSVVNQTALINIFQRASSASDMSIAVEGYFGNIPASSIRVYYGAYNLAIEVYLLLTKTTTTTRSIHTRVLAEYLRGSQIANYITLDNTDSAFVEPSYSNYVSMSYLGFLGNAATATNASKVAVTDGTARPSSGSQTCYILTGSSSGNVTVTSRDFFLYRNTTANYLNISGHGYTGGITFRNAANADSAKYGDLMSEQCTGYRLWKLPDASGTLALAGLYLPLSGGTLTGWLTITNGGGLSLMTKSSSSLASPNLDLNITAFGYENSSDPVISWKIYSYQGTSESPAGVNYMPITFGASYPSAGALVFTGSKAYSGTTYDNYWGIATKNPLYLLHVNGTFGAGNTTVSLLTTSGNIIKTLPWYTRGTSPSSRQLTAYLYLDKDGKYCGWMEYVCETSGEAHIGFYIVTPTSSTNSADVWRGFKIYKPSTTTYGVYTMSFNIGNGLLYVPAETGTAPLSIRSTDRVANLNADMVDGKHASDFALSSHSHSYLPLTGGTMSLSSVDSFVIKKTSNQNSVIRFTGLKDNVDTLFGYLGVSGVNNPVFRNTSGVEYTLIHSGNYTSYCLPISGGSTTGSISVKHTTLDLSASNNGISSTLWTGYRVLDKDNRISALWVNGTYANGNNHVWVGVRNYNTSGTLTADKGLGLTVAKDGTATWSVSDADKFRTAISALSTSGGTLSGGLTIKGSLALMTKSDTNQENPNLDLYIGAWKYTGAQNETVIAWKYYSYQGPSENPAGIGYMPLVFGTSYAGDNTNSLIFTGSKSYSGTTYDNYWGINTSNPQYLFHVNGNIGAKFFYASSDRSKKTNIIEFSEHIRKFTWKDSQLEAYGVIALEVLEMFRDGKEGSMTVNYDSVLSYYIGLLENRVKYLEEKIKYLETKN